MMILKNRTQNSRAVRRFVLTFSVSVRTNSIMFPSCVNVIPPTATIPLKNLQLLKDVISVDQEKTLIKFIDAIIKRKRYEKNHFDDVILNYRETEIYAEKLDNFPEAFNCLQVVEKTIRNNYTPGGAAMKLIPPHVIDLHATGFIAPHIDSIKFSGDMIASLSLASARIMRLKLDPEFAHLYPPSEFPHVPTTIEFVVHPRSLYILSGSLRYHYTHEILGTTQTALTTLTSDMVDGAGGATVTGSSVVTALSRRLSIMHRDEKVN